MVIEQTQHTAGTEYYEYTRQDRPVSAELVGTSLTAASPNNYVTINLLDGGVWDVRGTAGVASFYLCLFETGTNDAWFNP